MTSTNWTPDIGPKISTAWHAIRDCLITNRRVDSKTLVAVATSTGIVEKTAVNLLADLKNHGYISRRKGIYELRDGTPSSPQPPKNPTRDPLWAEVDDLRAEVARLRVACTEFEDAYVGEHEDRVKAEAEVERVRGVLRDAYGKLWNQAEADHARADAAETKVRAVEALADRVPPPDFVRADGTEVRDGCRGHIDVRDLRTALAVVPPGVTPPAEQGGEERG
jgi:hypothetical protein